MLQQSHCPLAFVGELLLILWLCSHIIICFHPQEEPDAGGVFITVAVVICLWAPLWIRMLSDEEICERQENRHQRLLEFQPQQGRSYKAGTPLQNVGKNPICRPLHACPWAPSHEKVNSNLSSWRYRRDAGGRWGEPVCTVRRKQWGFKSCARASAI